MSNEKILLLSNEKTYSIEIGGYTENVVPKMTSNTAPSGVVSASSFFSGDNPFEVFDRDATDSRSIWYASDNRPVDGHWIKYDFGINNEKRIVKITLVGETVTGLGGYGLKNFKLFGSNDDVNFVELYSGTNPNSNEKVEHVFTNKNKYRYYRLNTLDSHSTKYPSRNVVKEWEMMEYIFEINQLPSHSEQNLIKYGIDSPVQVDGICNGKNYILQDTVSEDVDGLWKTQITRKPLSIKFD